MSFIVSSIGEMSRNIVNSISVDDWTAITAIIAINVLIGCTIFCFPHYSVNVSIAGLS